MIFASLMSLSTWYSFTVRAFNERARKFYERYGFKYDSDIEWNSKETGVIPGVIYRLQLEKIKSDKFFQF